MTATAEHLPPQSLDAEISALGAMMRSQEAVEVVIERCRVDDFYSPAHRLIYDAIAALTDRGEPVDLITVKEQLSNAGKLDGCGGIEYLVQVVESVPTAANASYYAEIVRRKAMLRNLSAAAAEVEALVHSDQEFEQIFDRAEHAIFSASQRRMSGYFQPAKDLISTYFEEVQDVYDTGKRQMGVSTGFDDLDRKTTGLYAGDLTIIAARPSVGKTALVLDVAVNIALHAGLPVAFFSLEMSAPQIGQRMVCARAKVSSVKLRTGDISEEDFGNIHQAVDRLFNIPLYVDDSSDVASLEVLAKCRRLKAEHRQLGLVVVDYLQLMRGSSRTENRTQEISEIARGLKRIAKELAVPVIALSQLSRAVEQREDKHPQLSDLRESGSIEAEADVVWLLYRPSYYSKRPGGAESSDDESRPDERWTFEGVQTDKVEVNIAKHRNGPTGRVELAFQPEFARFLPFHRGDR